MKNILVTGGAGFIGANFVRYFIKQYPNSRLVNLDALTYAGNPRNLADIESSNQYHFVHGNICDQSLAEDVLNKFAIDTIVHFAAESHVDRSITGPDAFIESNIVGTHSLLKAALKIWKTNGALSGKRFHHVSTDEVYGTLGQHDPAFTEVTPYAPNSPYAASKAGSDHLVRAYHHTFGLPVTTSNCSNNYGPYQFPEKLIPLCLLNILSGKPLPIYGDGKQVRDWLHVEDHNRGICQILKSGKIGETYNIGGNNEWANIDTVTLLCKIVDQLFQVDNSLGKRFPESPSSKGELSKSLITFVSDRLGHDVRYAIDATKITRELGFSPETRFQEGLKSTVCWYLDNEDWWQSVLDGTYRNIGQS